MFKAQVKIKISRYVKYQDQEQKIFGPETEFSEDIPVAAKPEICIEYYPDRFPVGIGLERNEKKVE
jgi:hypothetical protein